MQAAVQRRPTLLLIVVLAVLLAIMSASSRTRVVGETRTLLERTLLSVFSPVPIAMRAAHETISDLYHGYLDMRSAVKENVEFRRRVADLTRENIDLRRSRGELARLRDLLGFGETLPMKSTLAHVVMLDTSGPFRSMLLDRGSDHGVEINDTVVGSQGLVGRVVLTTRELSKVQLIIDTGAGAGCRITRTRRQGVVRGDGRGALQLEYIPALSDVVPGDLLETAGTDGIYPRGIAVATITEIAEGRDLFKTVQCLPTVDFSSIEEVFVLHTSKIPVEVMRYEP